jgi:hypothetical protein
MRTRIIRLVVRFARRNTLLYDEDLTDLPRDLSPRDESHGISQYGQRDARRRLVRFSTELQKLYFQTRPKILAGIELLI